MRSVSAFEGKSVKILDTAKFWSGQQARKTKGLKAKHLSSVLSDPALISKLLLDTLEAKEVLTPDVCICMGEAGDAWQQTAMKLIKDYELRGIDTNGWLLFEPKPTKIVEFFEVTEEILEEIGAVPTEPVYIVGLWGAKIGDDINMQRVRLGDFVARQLDQHEDQWVVQRAIWKRSYS